MRDVFLGGRGILSERLFELLCRTGGNGRWGVGYIHVGCTVHAGVVVAKYNAEPGAFSAPNYAGFVVTS